MLNSTEELENALNEEETMDYKWEVKFSRTDNAWVRTVHARPKGTSKWSVDSKTLVEFDPELNDYVPIGETSWAIRTREQEEQEKTRQAQLESAKESALSHQSRIDGGIAKMTDVEYAFFTQLDDIKVLLGGVRADSKFADEISVAPKLGMGAYLLNAEQAKEEEASSD